jgi:MFS family permease
MGMTGGMWMSRVPAAKAQAHLTDGTLGLALFAAPVGLILGAVLAERLVDRVGSAWVARVGGVGSCLLLMLPGLASSLPELMAALLGWGVASGALDVAQNAQGLRVEAAYGRPVMTSMHAFYSLGAIIGSLAGGGLAWAGVGLLASLVAAGAAGAVIDAVACRWLLPGTTHPDPRLATPPLAEPAEWDWPAPHDRPGGPPGQDQRPTAGHDAITRALDRRRVRRLIIAIGVLGVCGAIGEGSAGDWSAVYLRDNLGTSAGFAALGFAAFSATMTIGRALGDRLIRRFGVAGLIRCCGAVAAVGLAAALITASPVATVAGFALFGAGLSAVLPQVFAAGGRADPAHPGSGVAKVVGSSYAGMSAGPAVIGGLASRIGLHAALAIPAVLALWIAVGAAALTPPGSARKPPDAPGRARTSPDKPERARTSPDEPRTREARTREMGQRRGARDR